MDSNKVMDLLEAYFPDVSAELHLSGRDTILQEALKSQFSERHLQSETPFMDKVNEWKDPNGIVVLIITVLYLCYHIYTDINYKMQHTLQ